MFRELTNREPDFLDEIWLNDYDLTEGHTVLPDLGGLVFEDGRSGASTKTPAWNSSNQFNAKPADSTGAIAVLRLDNLGVTLTDYSLVVWEVLGLEIEANHNERVNIELEPPADTDASGAHLGHRGNNQVGRGFYYATGAAKTAYEWNWRLNQHEPRPMNHGIFLKKLYVGWRVGALLEGNIIYQADVTDLETDTTCIPMVVATNASAQSTADDCLLDGLRLMRWR